MKTVYHYGHYDEGIVVVHPVRPTTVGWIVPVTGSRPCLRPSPIGIHLFFLTRMVSSLSDRLFSYSTNRISSRLLILPLFSVFVIFMPPTSFVLFTLVLPS